MNRKKITSTICSTVKKINVLAFASPDLSEAGQGLVLAVLTKGEAPSEVATFLMDVHCLGVRKVTLSKLPLKSLLDNALPALRVVPVSVPEARGIVEGAVAFAKKLGFSAPENLPQGLVLFGESAAQKPSFPFGKSGKPFYTQQRGDDDDFVETVLTCLKRNCGEHGFGFSLDEPGEDWLDNEDSDSTEEENGEE